MSDAFKVLLRTQAYPWSEQRWRAVRRRRSARARAALKSRTHQRPSQTGAGAFSRRPLEREISIDRMCRKDGDAKHTQDYRNHFNHFDAPLLLVHVMADPGFMPASSGLESGFARTID
jgi:hypothetical protein